MNYYILTQKYRLKSKLGSLFDIPRNTPGFSNWVRACFSFAWINFSESH